MIYLYN